MPAVFNEILYGPVVIGLAAGVVAFQIVVFVMAARRRGRGPLSTKVHGIAAVAIAGVAVAIGVSAHAARVMAMRAMRGEGNPLGDAVGLLTGLAGQTNAIAFGVATVVLALSLWFAGLALTLAAPMPDGRARSFPSAALVGLGLLPVAYGALRWSTAVIHRFSTLEDIPEEQRSAVIERTIDAARAQFQHSARRSMVAIAVLTIIAVSMIILRARNPLTARPSPRRALPLAAAFIVVAGLLVVGARPMANENDLPWPPPATGFRLPSIDPPTPDLVGPDTVEWAPVVQVHPDRLGLDGSAVPDFATLYDRLDLLRVNYRSIHHGGDFNDTAVIVADPRTPTSRLQSVLQAALKAEYHKPLFAFTKTETVQRPVLGKLQRIIASGVRVKLAYADGKNTYGDAGDDDDEESVLWADAVPVRPRDFTAYEPFARRLVELRRADNRAVVRIDRPTR